MIRVPTEQESADYYWKAKNEGGGKPDDLVRLGIAPPELVEAARAELASEPRLADLLNVGDKRGLVHVDDLAQLPSNLRDLAYWALDNFGTRRRARAELFAQPPGTELADHNDAAYGPDRALTIALEPDSGAHFRVGGSAADHHEVGTEAMMLPGEVWAWHRRSRHSARNDSNGLRIVMILQFDPAVIIAPAPGKPGVVWMVGEDDRGNEARIFLGSIKLAYQMMDEWLSSRNAPYVSRLRCGPECLKAPPPAEADGLPFMKTDALIAPLGGAG